MISTLSVTVQEGGMGAEGELEAALAGAPGPVVVMAKDLEGRRVVRRGAQRRVPAASSIKVPILGAIAAAVHARRLDWDAAHTLSGRQLEVPGGGVLTRFRPPVTLSLYNLATLMIIVSDNAATNYVIELVGFEAINRFCLEHGMANTQCVRLMRSGGVKLG